MLFKGLLATLVTSSLICNQASALTLRKTQQRGSETWISLKVQLDQAKLDALFVVDDSGSMGSYQQKLADASAVLGDYLSGYSDVNAAVITTSAATPAGSYYPGTKGGDGKFVGPVVNSSDANFAATLAQNILVGTTGSATEQPLGVIPLALAPALLSTVNVGFLRADADLLIVILTDAEDQSSWTTQGLVDELKVIKGARGIYTLAGLTDGSKDCPREDGAPGTAPLKILDFVKATGGSTFSMCAEMQQSFTEALPELTTTNLLGEVYVPSLPNEVVDVATMTVKVGETELPRGDINAGWVFDSATNKILLGKDVNYGKERYLTVDYRLVPQK